MAFEGIDLTFQLAELRHQVCIIAKVTELGGYIVLFLLQTFYLTLQIIDDLLFLPELFIQLCYGIVFFGKARLHSETLTGFTE